MDILFETFYVILPPMITAGLGWLAFIHKREEKEKEQRRKKMEAKKREDDLIREAQSRAIMLIMRHMLKMYHSEYMLQGKITYNQFDNWKETFDTYRDLNGNHKAIDWNNDVCSLPRTDTIPNMSPFEVMLRKNMDK